MENPVSQEYRFLRLAAASVISAYRTGDKLELRNTMLDLVLALNDLPPIERFLETT